VRLHDGGQPGIVYLRASDLHAPRRGDAISEKPPSKSQHRKKRLDTEVSAIGAGD